MLEPQSNTEACRSGEVRRRNDSLLRLSRTGPGILPGMLHTGARVLVCTSYGELPGRIVAIADARINRVYVPHPAYIDYRDGFHVRAVEVRLPLDFTADEPGRTGPRLSTTRPAYTGAPPYGSAGMPEPRRRVKRIDRDIN